MRYVYGLLAVLVVLIGAVVMLFAGQESFVVPTGKATAPVASETNVCDYLQDKEFLCGAGFGFATDCETSSQQARIEALTDCRGFPARVANCGVLREFRFVERQLNVDDTTECDILVNAYSRFE